MMALNEPEHEPPIAVPEMPEGPYEHQQRLQAELTRRIMDATEEAAALTRGDGQVRTVVMRDTDGHQLTWRIDGELADRVEHEEWAGHGTSWLQNEALKRITGLGADLRRLELDAFSFMTLAVTSGKEAAAPGEEEPSVPKAA